MKSRMLARASLIFLLTLGVIIDGPFARATDAISLTPSASSVAPGQTVDLTAAMPVVAAGSTTQTLTQVIDPTKVKLTSASDITSPAGWTLSYSTDGTSFSSTAPTTTAGWAAIRAVRATGDLVSSGSSNGFQVASRTATGASVNLAPPTTTASVAGSDGYQAFFDAGRTRVFNIFHHSSALTASLDCHVISTGATCVGFPMAFGGQTDEAANGVVVGSTIWAASVSGFYCIDIAAVLANTSNSSGGGSPSKCFSSGSTALVTGTSGKRLTWFTGASKLGQSAETKLYALNPTSTPNAEIYCIDTATRTLCSGSPTSSGISGAAMQLSFDTSNILKVGDLLYISVTNQNTLTNTLNCLNVTTWSRCSGWTANFAGPSGLDQAGKFLDVPNAAGSSRGVCYLSSNGPHQAFTPASTTCWDSLGQTFTAASVNIPSMVLSGWAPYGNPVRLGTRLYFGNANYGGPGKILCYDATANSNTGGYCNGDTNVLSAIGTTYNLDNYTVTPDPSIPNCVWITRDAAPIIRTIDILNKRDGCSSIAPTTASFSGSAIVPRMACNSNQDAIRQWESFTLKTAGTGTFTSATLTVKNSSGVAISGWTDRAVSLNTALDLSGLSPGSTGLTPSFEVAFGGITGSITTASAEVKVVGDSPELCTRVTAAYVCPTGSGPITALTNNTATVSANGSSVLGGATTTLPQVDQSITVTAPALSTCTSSITGRAGDGGGGSSGTAISGVTVSLLDSSGNPVLVNGSPVTTTTASDGTYSFAGLLPNSYKVKFSTPSGKTLVSSTTVSGAAGTTAGATASPAISCPGGGTSSSIQSGMSAITGSSVLTRATPTNLVANGDFAATSPSTSGTVFLFGTQGANRTLNSVTAPVGTIDNWTTLGGTSATYAFWNNGLGAPITPILNQTSGNSASYVYFGNSSPADISPLATYSAAGWSTGPYTITPATGYGTASTPPAIRQTISTVAGDTYRLQFLQGYENWGSSPGIAALDITGYSRSYFSVPKTVNRYTVEFLATSSQTAITFSSWGHVGGATELAMDDVIVNVCLPPQADFASAAAVTAAGTNAVVNALYTIPATAAADTPAAGTQGSAQTINVLSNDSAASGATLTASTVRFCGLSPAQTPPSCSQTTLTTADGTYSVNTSTGVVTFTPNASFTGTATQPPTYQVTDSASNVISSTITPSVIARPALTADTSSGAWDQNQTISPLANDVAGNGASLVANSVKLCASGESSPNCTLTSRTITGQGTYTVNSDGTITFDPLPGFTGTASPVTYTVTDSVGQKSSSTITPSVSSPNAPIAAADTTSGAKGAAQSVNLLANDAPGIANNAGLTLVASSAKLCDPTTQPAQVAPNCTATSVTVSGVGTYSISNGVVTFTPLASFSGSAEPLPYQVADSTGQVATASYTPTVIPPPALTADTSSGAWDQNQTISPLANDVAGNGASLVANSVKLCASGESSPNCTATSLTITGQGTYTVNADGTITFNPLPSFTGDASPVTYSVTDSVGQKSSTTITPSVSAPGAPVANPQTKLVSPTGTTAFTTITGSNGLATGTQLSPSQTFLCDVAPNAQTPPNCTATTVTTPDGTWVLSQITGVATYQPNAGTAAGNKTAVTYQVSDPAGQSASALLTPVIPPAPTANPDSSSGQQGQAQVISLLGNDQPGIASNPLEVDSVKFCVGNQVAPNCSATSLTVNGEGTYTIDSFGIVTFTPIDSFTGAATPITYQVSDSIGQSVSSTLSIDVIPPPAPIANRDLGSAAYGQAVVFEPWKNDSGGAKPAGATQADPQVVPTSTRLCASGQSAPNCAATTITTVDGTYALDTATGKVTFTPASGFSGTATAPVTYQISNNWTGPSGAATTTAILIPTIAAPGDPLATNDKTSTKPDTPVILKPIINDSAGSFALDASTLRLCDATDIAPNCTHLTVTNAHGTYVVDPATGGVTFTPAKGFKGIATIPYVLSDMNARFANANLFITVSSDASTTPSKANEKDLAKTGTNGAYALGSLAIISAMAGTALVASSQRKQTRA